MNLQYFIKKYRLMLAMLCLLFAGNSHAQVDAPGQVWQWAIDVKGGINQFGMSRAYMWIPENCSQVRAMVVAQNNMEEFSVIENQQFRDSMASVNIGIIWVSPMFDGQFNFQTGAGEVFLQMMQDLANVSGYPELKNVAIVPMGHSATANFPAAFTAWSNERTLCGISISGTAPYDFTNLFAENFWCNRRVDYVPHLTTNGEYEAAGDIPNANWSRVFNRIDTNQFTPFSFLPVSGEFHFATSQRKTNFIANFIKKASQYRLVTPATATALAVMNLINPMTTGWRVDRWQKNMPARYAPAPVATYTGIRGESNWCFDQDMALRIEDFKNTYYRKTPCLLSYNQGTTPGVVGPQVAQNNNHVQVHLDFIPLNDSLDYELSSSFLDVIPAASTRCVGWMSTTNPATGAIINGIVGASIGKPSDNSLSVIDRELGPIAKLRKDPATGITTFRMTMERGLPPGLTNYVQYCIFSVAHPGDATYKASVLQAEMGISVYNTSGLAQTITFPQIADRPKTGLTNITLNGTSSLGMPVQYFVENGPVKIVGNQLVFTSIPLNTKFPLKVTIFAWQWGRDAGLAARTTATSAPFAGQLIQTAQPVENTFYITDVLLPVTLAKFNAELVNDVVNVDWQTASEINSKEFIIEKSKDANTWVTVGIVAAKGSASNYGSKDLYPFDGLSYYRLKSVDKDNSFKLSRIVSIFRNKTHLLIKKTGNQVTVTGGRESASMQINLYNSIGANIFVSNQKVPITKLVTAILPQVQTGVYFITVKTDGRTETLKIFID